MLRLICLGLTLVVARAYGQPFTVPPPELAYPPTPGRVARVIAAAERDGWAPQIAPLRTAAREAYAKSNLWTADAWFHLYAWASLLGERESEFVPRWINAINVAQVGHAGMPRTYPTRPLPLSTQVSPEFQRWALGDAAFANEFFSVISPVDYLPEVFKILDTLYRANPAQFKTYTNLALAIAVVYDLPPPPDWPHAQVRPDVLPRQFPPAADAFRWWIRQDEQGRTFHSLRRLRADELKFVVDAAAPFKELEWSQVAVHAALADLPAVYAGVKYQGERVAKNQPVWPGPKYRLTDILTMGGICADQAYFATEVGKARGVPTLLFTGAGADARHAWFGYLDGDQEWQLNAGRYAEQRYVTGFARDPQTWRQISDHELLFLQQHFRARASYRQSRAHEEFATDFLATGDSAAAGRAAREAVKFEPRNQDAWETLIEATHRQGADTKAVEVIMREAALAFQHYPDLEAFYAARVADSLRSRGQTSEAQAEIRRIVQKNQGDRVDIAVQQAHDMIMRAIETQPLNEQLRTYNSVVDNYAAGAGIAFFDQIVVVFVEHLAQLQHRPEALRALERARDKLGIQPNTQLASEFAKLQRSIAAAR
jgi:hypothetical protein